MNEQLDSQLSAMFDNQLPEAECELLARRLSRDEALKARWERYALISAAIRAERGVRPVLARRVTQALGAEAPLNANREAVPARPVRSGWQAAAGGAMLAAGVAAGAILWMRAEAPFQPSVPSIVSGVPSHSTSAQAPGSYVVPASPASMPARRLVVPSTQLANYLVAHFEVSSPVGGQVMLSSLVGGDAGGTGATASGSEELVPVEDVQENAKAVE
jgi:hypothetical protein